MWFPITTLCLLACIVAAHRRERRSALLVALYAWVVSLALGSPLLYVYRVDYLLGADALMGACLCVTTVCYLLVRRTPRDTPVRYERRAFEVRAALVMGVLGMVGCLLLISDAQAGGLQLNPSYLLENLSRIRDEQFQSLADAANRGAIGTLGGLTAPCGLLCILAAVRLGTETDRILRTVAVINFVLLAIVSLGVLAGRATITNVVLLALFSMYLSGRMFRVTPQTAVLAAAAVVSVWFLSTSWISTREDQAASAPILEKTQRASLRPWVESVASGNESVGLALVSIGYFASPIPTLHYYLQTPPLPGPFYGAYSFPLAARFIGTIDGTWTREQWYGLREEIYAPISSRGYFANVWSTWLRDLLVDFGYLGAGMFCALFGVMMAWARNRSEATGALHYHYCEVLVGFALGFGAFTSFLFDPFIAIPFVVAVVLMICTRVSLSEPQI